VIRQKRSVEPNRGFFSSRYLHLVLALFALYGLTAAVTHTSRFEKIVDCLKWTCLSDYVVRDKELPKDSLEWEFYKERYERRLGDLTRDLFEYHDEERLQDYFWSRGLAYEVLQVKGGRSYLLAPVLDMGYHKTDVPQEVAFNYYLLGEKEIISWREFQEGELARNVVSAIDGNIYIHKDSLDYILEEYFNLLWGSDVRSTQDFRWNEWELTLLLSRDLETLCEDVFIYRIYKTKRVARDYFVEEGFNAFFPAMLAMASRLAADRDAPFSPEYKYQRAYLTGLSLEPNFTMIGLLGYQSEKHNPAAAMLWREFDRRLMMRYPSEIRLYQVSETAEQLLSELEDYYY